MIKWQFQFHSAALTKARHTGGQSLFSGISHLKLKSRRSNALVNSLLAAHSMRATMHIRLLSVMTPVRDTSILPLIHLCVSGFFQSTTALPLLSTLTLHQPTATTARHYHATYMHLQPLSHHFSFCCLHVQPSKPRRIRLCQLQEIDAFCVRIAWLHALVVHTPSPLALRHATPFITRIAIHHLLSCSVF
jgi:hypothetical protein